MFPQFNDSTTVKKKQEAIGERTKGECPEHGANSLTASVVTKPVTECECSEVK